MFPDPSFTRCRVTTYSGYRGEERPSSLIIDGRELAILQLRTMRIEEDFHSRRRRRLFHVRTREGAAYLLCHDEATGEWSLRPDP